MNLTAWLGVLGVGGLIVWIIQRIITRPRPRIVIRKLVIGFDGDPSRIEFEVANGGSGRGRASCAFSVSGA